ncbi:MAG: proton-conducting transporter membrane subunit [Cytophagales bacterium]|nr:hypothetical protein [Bernardetiaceae bacterium]MDW8211580.1 proton-conducting transporter membrane subunit [Cytophagales bacterium]
MQLLSWTLMPLVGALGAWLLPFRWSKTLPAWGTLINLAGIGYMYAHAHFTEVFVWHWSKDVAFYWSADAVACTMLLMVNTVSLAVQIYSWDYMRHAQRQGDYFALLGLFTFAMNGLALSADLLSMFFFWEIVGFCSWALIGFERKRVLAAKAANKAFIINRLADLGFFLALASAWAAIHSFELSALCKPIQETWYQWIGFGLLLAALGKSAQLPFSVWLPDAMQGPTPVSALMHAATMVVSGIYLLIRVHAGLAPEVLQMALWIGSLTALLGALAASTQYDIKRTLAYSTISQLGLMLAALGADKPQAAFLHLLTHGFYKATLFLCAGMAIHYAGTQDLRQMGGLSKKRLLFGLFTLASAGLAGVPLTAGFLSKESILASVMQANAICFVVLLLTSLGTAFYTARLWFLAFYSRQRNSRNYFATSHDRWQTFALIALSGFIFFIAFSTSPLQWRSSALTAFVELPTPLHSWWIAVLAVGLLVGGAAIAWRIYCCRTNILATEEELARLPIWRTAYNFLYLDMLYYKLWKHTETSFAAFLNQKRALSPQPRIWAEGSRYFSFTAIGNYLERYLLPIFVAISRKTAQWEQQWLDRPIELMAKATVVLAHLQAWLDHKLVDGFVRLCYLTTAWLGKKTRALQQGKVQGYYITTLVFLLLLVLWLLTSCQPAHQAQNALPDLHAAIEHFQISRATLAEKINLLAQTTDSLATDLLPPEPANPAETTTPQDKLPDTVQISLQEKVKLWQQQWEEVLENYRQMQVAFGNITNIRDQYFEQMNQQAAQIADSQLRKAEFGRNKAALAAFNKVYRQWYKQLSHLRGKLYRGRDLRLQIQTALLRKQFSNQAIGSLQYYLTQARQLLYQADSLLEKGEKFTYDDITD